ncbi:hypothetical protein BJ944DRAFT_239297 [Cunninghamella echinulata]|nr:hypothetical protein BJ944DRAFT_239297 [Cunninghamella echinulata]
MEDHPNECSNPSNNTPYCSPKPEDIWKNGTNHQFIWNSQYPYYRTDALDLYLFYKNNNSDYQQIQRWKELDPLSGSLTVQVNDSWFPDFLYFEKEKKWTFYGFYLPSNINLDQEFLNPNSAYPSPFNFSVTQDKNINSQKIPIWIIIIIVITSIIIILSLIIFALWVTYKNTFKKKKDNNDSLDPLPIATVQNKTTCSHLSLSSSTSPEIPPAIMNQVQPSIIIPVNHLHNDSYYTSNWNRQEKNRKQISEELLRQELASDEDTCIKYASKRNCS